MINTVLSWWKEDQNYEEIVRRCIMVITNIWWIIKIIKNDWTGNYHLLILSWYITLLQIWYIKLYDDKKWWIDVRQTVSSWWNAVRINLIEQVNPVRIQFITMTMLSSAKIIHMYSFNFYHDTFRDENYCWGSYHD